MILKGDFSMTVLEEPIKKILGIKNYIDNEWVGRRNR